MALSFRSNAINHPEAVHRQLICNWNLSKNLLLRCTFFVHCNYCCYYELIYYKTHTLTTTNIEQIIILNCNLIDVKCRGNVSNKMQTQSIVLIEPRSVIIVMEVKWLRKLSSSSLSLSVEARQRKIGMISSAKHAKAHTRNDCIFNNSTACCCCFSLYFSREMKLIHPKYIHNIASSTTAKQCTKTLPQTLSSRALCCYVLCCSLLLCDGCYAMFLPCHLLAPTFPLWRIIYTFYFVCISYIWEALKCI